MEYLTAQTKRYLQSLVSYDTSSKAAIIFFFSYRSPFLLLNVYAPLYQRRLMITTIDRHLLDQEKHGKSSEDAPVEYRLNQPELLLSFAKFWHNKPIAISDQPTFFSTRHVAFSGAVSKCRSLLTSFEVSPCVFSCGGICEILRYSKGTSEQ